LKFKKDHSNSNHDNFAKPNDNDNGNDNNAFKKTSISSASFSSSSSANKDNANRIKKEFLLKSNINNLSTFVLGIIGGAFISLGAIFYTFVTMQITINYIITQVIGGIAFSLGPIMIVIAGAELFTANNLWIISLACKEIKLRTLVYNWGIVYLGNLIGAIVTAIIFYMTRTYESYNDEFALRAITIANNKINLTFSEALFLGIFCNALICLGVWMATSGKNHIDKAISMVFPITAFIAIGFEHSIANMYFIPFAMMLLVNSGEELVPLLDTTIINLQNLNLLSSFFHNLLPVSLGNIIGGSILVGLVYWIIYFRNTKN
jgi:formate transporter